MSARGFKHCPFCGSDPVIVEARDVLDGFVHHHSVHCFECGIEMGDEYLDDLAKSWNRRPRSPRKAK